MPRVRAVPRLPCGRPDGSPAFPGARREGKGLPPPLERAAPQPLAATFRSLSLMQVISGEGDRLGAADDLFPYLGGPDDAHAFSELVFGDAPRFGTGAAKPHLALVGNELSHEVLELWQPGRCDALAAAFAPQAHRLDRAEDDGVLSCRGGDVGGNEGQRCPLRLIPAPGAVEDELLVHFCLSTVMVRRPSSCASVDVTRCPSSLANEGRSSLAAGSLTTTSSDSPIGTLVIRGRNSCARPSAQPIAPASNTCIGPGATLASIWKPEQTR